MLLADIWKFKKEPERWQGFCWKTGQITWPILLWVTICITVTAVLHAFTSILSHLLVTLALLHVLEHFSLFSPIPCHEPQPLPQAKNRRVAGGRGVLKQERKFAKILGEKESRESWLILRIQGLIHRKKDVYLTAEETHSAVRQM